LHPGHHRLVTGGAARFDAASKATAAGDDYIWLLPGGGSAPSMAQGEQLKAIHEVQIIHSYDTELRRVRCGQVEQSNSTKHSRDVTCVTCRSLLDHPLTQGPSRAVAWSAPH
jgi:hypothetical protein